jgi:spermidine synthase
MHVLEPPDRVDDSLADDLCRGASAHRPFMLDSAGMRHLYFDLCAVQSSMRLEDPYALVTAYAQKMMAFLLFNRRPRHILLLGLGGGSLVKFCHRHLPDTQLTVMEVDAEIIGVRDWFHVPPDDDRLRVVLGDGADYVSRGDWSADILLIDAFDSAGVAPSLATAEFYAQAFRGLARNGVLVMNLSGERARYVAHLQRLREACPGRILLVPVARDGNILIFAFGDSADLGAFESLEGRAEELQAELALEFPRFLRRLREGEVM